LATVTGGSYYNTFAAATTVYIEAANGGEVEYDFGAQPALTINPLSVLTGITAHAGGTQALGVPLTGSINRVTVCATGGDSVLLPFGTVGKHVVVFNAGAAACNVFPQVGESIGVGAANAAFSVGISKGAVFDCVAAGIWNVVLSA
jgi:hypothetical protein